MADGQSISSYLVDLHKANVLKHQIEVERQATIRSEIDLVDSIGNMDVFSA